ncbi:MAG: class I SAM-dependent methyltransferase [Anaerolineales bacterium]|nr:class I SAM-dependent methyltransferase [Anaerolineales bacterium]
MYSQSSKYYDLIYGYKNYQAETEYLLEIIRPHISSQGKRLLDVACGTGRHIEYLKQYFEVEGLDINEEILAFARRRNPEIRFHLGDMTNFSLDGSFDVVTCLFSSIGYVKTLENLHRAIQCMARHVQPGGLLIIEPWFTPENWHADTVHSMFIDEPDLKLARINTSKAEGRLSYFDLHHLVGTPQDTEYFVERHEMGLFETQEMDDALVQAGLQVSYDPRGLTERGLFIGRKDQK